MTQPMTLAGLYCYPVKSCAGTALEAAELDAFGLIADRRWMVVQPDGVFLTQRKLPKMALIRPHLMNEGLCLEAPGMSALEVPAPPSCAPAVRVTVWNSTCQAVDAGDQAARWLSDFLEAECRLVGIDDRFQRRVNPEFALDDDSVSFADGFPLLLTNSASLEDLNRRLTDPLPMDRFRPNLVISGALPFAEDRWECIKIGKVTFHLVKPCARCVVTTVDQATAQQGEEPLVTLAGYRRAEDGGILFGQNLIHTPKRGRIRVGDPIEVLA